MLSHYLIRFALVSGDAAAVHCPHHCARDVEVEDRSGQLGHTLPDGPGRPAGQQPVGGGVARDHVRGHGVRGWHGDPQCTQLGPRS